MTSELPEHLGGQMAGNIDIGLVQSILKWFDVRSMVDIGCGDGAATEVYRGLGVDVVGVDGDWTRMPNKEGYVMWDFTQGMAPISRPFDLAYSVEFLEHIEERYLPNVMPLFSKCQFAVVTAALPGQEGHHHVNCREPEYWHNVFKQWGFKYDDKTTQALKKQSTMQKASGPKAGKRMKFFKRTGMFFRRV